jgi:hypothetical protein
VLTEGKLICNALGRQLLEVAYRNSSSWCGMRVKNHSARSATNKHSRRYLQVKCGMLISYKAAWENLTVILRDVTFLNPSTAFGALHALHTVCSTSRFKVEVVVCLRMNVTQRAAAALHADHMK